MKGFPPPPGGNRSQTPGATPQGVQAKSDSIPPKPPPTPTVETVNGRLSEDEVTVILRSTLLPEHREDPNVLRFISNYLRCRNSSQAAEEAGLDRRSGYNLRQRPDIHRAIEILSQRSVMKYGFDASEVVERFKEVANVDPIDFLRPDGSYRMLHEMSPEARRAIKKFKAKNLFEKDPNGMEVQVGVLVEIELWDKLKAGELLGREKELFVEKKKVEHDVSSNMASFLLESKKRADERFSQLKDVTPVLEIEGKVERDE